MSAPVVSPRVRWAAVSAVVVVAGVAAVMSYGHLRAVAAQQGEDAAALFPLSVDGLIVAASLVLLTRRRCGQPGGVLAWSSLLVGVAATVAGNVASAEPTALARLVAAWPPVAFALSYELLLTLLRPAPAPAERAEQPPAWGPTPAGREEWATAGWPVPAGREEWAAAGEPVGEPPPAAGADSGGRDRRLEDRARELLAAANGRPPGRRALARELGCSEHRARTVLDAMSTPGTHAERDAGGSRS